MCVRWTIPVLLSLVVGCGSTSAPSDGSIDTGADTVARDAVSSESAHEASVDAANEASVDAPNESSVDAARDVFADVSHDAAVDAITDADATGAPDFVITSALTLDPTTVASGTTLHGTVTYTNMGTAPLSIQAVTITTRPPGGTHSGGPYDDLAPSVGAMTVAAGASVTVDATRVFTDADPAGTWEGYSTWHDASGAWHDGPSVSFTVTAPAHPMAPNGYYVVGNTVYDATGTPHLFHGVDRPSLEWASTGDHLSASDYMLMAGWHARVVRIALDQDFWLATAANYDANYEATVDQQVQWAHAAGLDVILDLHWSDAGNLADTMPGQQRMADTNSLTFWQQVAAHFMNDGRVLFELYNEPHDITWDVWLSGGPSGDGFTAVGMQQLYDAVRGTGAENLVIAGGNSWASDLTGVPTHRIVGHNILYAAHPYDWPSDQPSDWPTLWGSLAATDPVIATEFGDSTTTSPACSTTYYSSLISYADANNVSWTSWAWYPSSCTFPSIIADWAGTPNAMGTVVRDALLAYP